MLPIYLIQGPLAGYSCAPLRMLAARYGKPDFCCTEMISAKDLIHRKQNKPRRYLARNVEEQTVSYQISGKDVNEVSLATRMVTEAGADIVDLNCGCPVHKIRAKHTGSRLLGQPELLHDLVVAMRENTDAKVSVKIRVPGDAQDHDQAAVIQAAESAGVDFITVHGRHWTERYDVPVRCDQIKDVVDMASVPVYANGDIEDAQSYRALIEATGAAGGMIARAGVGRPWLFEQIRCELAGKSFALPSFSQVGEMLLEHVEYLIKLESEKMAVLQARKLAKYYARDLPTRREFVLLAQVAETFVELQQAINIHFMIC